MRIDRDGAKSFQLLAAFLVLVAAWPPSAQAAAPSIRLSQAGCFNRCVYDMRVFADDRYDLRVYRQVAEFEPDEHVADEHGQLPAGTYTRAMRTLENARYQRFRESYHDERSCKEYWTDQRSTIIEVTSDTAKKSIDHYQGCRGFRRREALVQLEIDLAAIFEVDTKAILIIDRKPAEAEAAEAEALPPEDPTEQQAIVVALAMLDRADSVELLSLDSGEGNERDWEAMCQGWCFYGWPVLGSVRLTERAELDVVRDELRRWLRAPEPEAIAMCYFPRHGVRVREAGSVHDFLVCFECGEVQLHVDFGLVPAVHKYRSGDQDSLDALFRAHGVRYMPRREVH